MIMMSDNLPPTNLPKQGPRWGFKTLHSPTRASIGPTEYRKLSVLYPRIMGGDAGGQGTLRAYMSYGAVDPPITTPHPGPMGF